VSCGTERTADPVDVDLHIREALDRSALIPDGSDVNADTKDGIITVTGHVRTWAGHDAVVDAAQMAIGVRTGSARLSPARWSNYAPGVCAAGSPLLPLASAAVVLI
jgi:osmotically-inducible protein OsmY